ncbi:EAL domain-containing protein [Vibrio sp. TH_r3]|uniref:cyclic diguanylate phosphodiesterase n=1 Tax=Vibrio sp. TH_r3 TaxID=3082084 RepID=UPI002954F00C|nr:EAL domain-containing protein [Vibrio sp. TH_r3]MDV7103395.1 EAL domain-containing protein [Vibrio sp. TH_r3]
MPHLDIIKSISSNAVSYGKHRIGVRVIQIFLLFMLLSLLVLIPFSNYLVSSKTHSILKQIEYEFSNEINQLSYLLSSENITLPCEDNLTNLRKSVFNSNRAKEIGIFDKNGKIFCTSNHGETSFYLYQSIIARLQKSPQNVTLSYTEAKLSKSRSVTLLFSNQVGEGLSVLIPPRYLTRYVDQQFIDDHIEYKLRIISRSIQDRVYSYNLVRYSAKSDIYPVQLEVSTTPMYYVTQFWRYSWIFFVLASLVSIYYVFREQKLLDKNSLENSLRSAITNDYLEIHYQPIVSYTTGKPVGCEALLRWKDPQQGFISPNIFIPLAEKLNLIEDVTKIVISKVVSFIRSNNTVLKPLYISINISRSVILKPSFVTFVQEILTVEPTLANKIVFEITEDNNFTFDELKLLKTQLEILSNLGFKFAVDDFGTGYSGLNFIRQFAFDYVKIDRVFVKNLSNDSTITALLKSMKTLSEQLNMTAIVEGVEESSQLEILNNLGFEYVQGFYFSKPLPSTEFTQYLQKQPL